MAILSEEDFIAHECDLPLKTIKRIEVAYFTDLSNKQASIVSGRGIDGVLYTFEVVPRKQIPITLPLTDKNLQRKRTDGDLTVPVQPI